MVGSIAMLLAFLAIFRATGEFDFPKLAQLGRSGELPAAVAMNLAGARLDGDAIMTLLFLGVVLGFAVKVPLMPFHTWLPSTYAEAPTGVTMLLTGVMSKLGVYGFLRLVLPIFPQQARMLATPLLWLAVITIVVSACLAFAQRDLKRTLAYSSINHLGYCLLGMFAAVTGSAVTLNDQAAALSGALLQMFNHGITAAALFCAVGLLEERSGGLRGLNDFGGLRKIVPIFCGLMGISLFASLGLPGLSGFVGEFLIFKGVFALAPVAAAVSTLGLLVTAVFILTILQRVFSGPLNEQHRSMPDLSIAERLLLVPPVVIMFVLGIWPAPLVDLVNETVLKMAAHLNF
jgi:NADH-quinone oxidoreductase subunit M